MNFFDRTEPEPEGTDLKNIYQTYLGKMNRFRNGYQGGLLIAMEEFANYLLHNKKYVYHCMYSVERKKFFGYRYIGMIQVCYYMPDLPPCYCKQADFTSNWLSDGDRVYKRTDPHQEGVPLFYANGEYFIKSDKYEYTDSLCRIVDGQGKSILIDDIISALKNCLACNSFSSFPYSLSMLDKYLLQDSNLAGKNYFRELSKQIIL